MSEQAPDDTTGIDRRDLLRGLGFGAVGAMGTALGTDGALAQEPVTSEMIDFVTLVPPDAAADGELPEPVTDTPTAGVDLVFQLDSPGLPKSETLPIGYQILLVSQANDQVVTSALGADRSICFGGIVKTTPGGETRHREQFSIAGLGPPGSTDPPNDYWAVLSVIDLSGLPGECRMDCASVSFAVQTGAAQTTTTPTEEPTTTAEEPTPTTPEAEEPTPVETTTTETETPAFTTPETTTIGTPEETTPEETE